MDASAGMKVIGEADTPWSQDGITSRGKQWE